MRTRLIYSGLLAGLFLSLFPAITAAANITAVWVNDGGDKVTQDELRATRRLAPVTNRTWDGVRVALFGARNEVVSFNVILEAGNAAASNVTVSFNNLSGPTGSITSSPATGNGVFNWTQRPIELFYVRYLQIKGLSVMSYEIYDERHVPQRMRRPWSGDGVGSGSWSSRPGHDLFYPDIAVPLELVPTFTIAAGKNQSIWVDIYIPKNTQPGLLKGTLTVQEPGAPAKNIPVELKVFDFALPDMPSAKTMLYYSPSNINRRYIGRDFVDPASADSAKAKLLRDRHFMLAHRHRISLIGDPPESCAAPGDQPCPEWLPRLNGSLFTASNGYDGPGVGTGNNVYSVGTFGSWSWKSGTEADMRRHTDAWVAWFERNAPDTEYFLYLDDESSNYAQTEKWAQWILNNPGPGKRMKSMATLPLPSSAQNTPSLDIPTSTLSAGIASQWQPLADRYGSDTRKRFFVYNGHRPATGSFATEDEGVALRELAWVQYKKHIHRWFFWESTYYNNFQGNTGQVNVFQNAHTFGNSGTIDAIKGETGWNHSNGDGVLFYPGTDLLFPANSYGVEGPFASLRLKQWRRGIQDVDYLTMAAKGNPQAVQALVEKQVPKALWEYGVTDPNDATYVRTDISWSIDSDAWESARQQLAVTVSSALSAAGAAGTLQNVKVFPNPWRKDRHNGSPITFDLLPAGCTVKIFTVSAQLVKEFPHVTGPAVTWDLNNDSGDKVASGIYIYVVTADGQESKRGKLALIR